MHKCAASSHAPAYFPRQSVKGALRRAAPALDPLSRNASVTSPCPLKIQKRLGEYLDDEQTLAVLICRLNSLAQGYSGVRWELLEQLLVLIEHRLLPFIPSEGSVGASGDLTPLSYVAAALIGERDVRFGGQRRKALDALLELGVTPLRLAPKEGLAIMNGTAVMTALACLAWKRAESLSRLCCRLTALA